MLWLKRLLGLSLAATGLWLAFVLVQQVGLVAQTRQPDNIAWTKFDAAAIPALVAQGKVVFVDVTAEWCLTCKANKEFVLTHEPVVSAARQDGGNGSGLDRTRPQNQRLPGKLRPIRHSDECGLWPESAGRHPAAGIAVQ